MNNVKFRRFMAGMCVAAACVTGMGVSPVTALADDTTLNDYDATRSGDTEVKAEVVENDNNPTYEIVIPKTVDFGKIQQPTTEVDNYALTEITVKCAKAENLGSAQVVAVLVKDATAQDEKSPFKLMNNTGGELQYEMYDATNTEIHKTTWYPNGFLFSSFTGANQVATDTLRLNRAQLYGKDLAQWGGAYTGTLHFYTRIAGIGDVIH